VVEWDGLENRCAFTGTVGSNPTLSATSPLPELLGKIIGRVRCEQPRRRPLRWLAKAKSSVAATLGLIIVLNSVDTANGSQ
jgi:hypothetical protein